MAWAILDSSIYVGHWERGLYDDLLAAVRRVFVVRHSAVVFSELRRGARTRQAQALVASLLERATTCWEPTVADWWEAGLLIRAMADAQDWDRNKRREFQNDALIALTAKRHGATVVTANRSDYALLSGRLAVPILVP
jgi:predicted nucleic acid-binding protein